MNESLYKIVFIIGYGLINVILWSEQPFHYSLKGAVISFLGEADDDINVNNLIFLRGKWYGYQLQIK